MKHQHIKTFTDYLHILAQEENRAALAALRRALSGNPRYITDTFQYIGYYLPVHPQAQDNYILVGALFAYHPETTTEGNLGAHFAELRRRLPDRADALERRFSAMLKAHPDDLTSHLRAAVGLLKGQEIPVNWYQLLYDVSHWGHIDRFVQRQWANAFWGRESQ